MRRVVSLMVAPRSTALLLLLAAGAWGCSSDDDLLDGTPPPTEIAVDPLEFLADLPCSKDEGAAKSFVAVLTDQTEGFTLAASPPSPCSSRMAFRYVIIGHAYSAEVDVYDVPADALFPVGGATSGSRVLTDAQGVVVPPRWRTRCGAGSTGPAVAVDRTSVVVPGCEPLASQGGGATALVVDPSDALGGLTCTDEGGPLDALRVSLASGPEGGGTIAEVTIACGGEPITFSEGIVPGGVYTFRLEGLAAGEAEAGWASRCVAVAAEGVARRAACEPLAAGGAIRAGVGDPTDPGFVCGIDFDSFEVSLTGPADLTVPRTACDEDVVVSPVPPGRYEGELQTYEGGSLERTATCAADVIPGETSVLTCSFP